MWRIAMTSACDSASACSETPSRASCEVVGSVRRVSALNPSITPTTGTMVDFGIEGSLFLVMGAPARPRGLPPFSDTRREGQAPRVFALIGQPDRPVVQIRTKHGTSGVNGRLPVFRCDQVR